MENQNINVAIIDDDFVLRLIVKKMLSKFPSVNVCVRELGSALDALDFFKQCRLRWEKELNMLLVDINMPLIGGWELIEIMAKENMEFLNKIPIYILSSSTSMADKLRVQDYPFLDGYLEKPLAKQQIFDLIRKHFDV